MDEQTVIALATALRTGDAALEAKFIAALDEAATRLAAHDPQQLSTLLTKVADVPLASAAGQQLRAYFTGLALVRHEQHRDALAHFDALLATPALDPSVRGRVLNSRAYCHSILGQPEAAMEGLQRALGLWRELDDRLNEGKALLNLGILAYEMQQYHEAETHLLQADHCFQAVGAAQMTAVVANELGLVYRDQGRWTDALRFLQVSATQARAEGADDALATELLNIGEVQLLQGQLVNAEGTLNEALTTMQTRTHQVDVYLALGLVQQVRGDLIAAQQAYETALAVAHVVERRDILAEIHFRLGDVQRRRQDDEAALASFTTAAQMVEVLRDPIRSEGLKISLLGRWQQIYETLVLHCLRMDDPVAAWQWSERARARAFAEQLASSTPAGVNADTGDVVDLADLQAALPADACLLNYFTTGVFAHHTPFWRMLGPDNPLRDHLLTPAQTLLFVITQTKLTVHHCPVDPNAFESASLRAEDRSRFLAPTMLTQFHRLLMPRNAAEPVQRLYIAPHGPLHHVAFGALRSTAGESIVRKEGPALVYTPSATILVQQRRRAMERSAAALPCLALGYDGDGAGRQLRHTKQEAAMVAHLTRGEAWAGDDIDLAALREQVGRARWLHFACHGWFDYEEPLTSYLEMGENRRLSAAQVLATWQLEAELVVLSACQTGVHRLLRSDEPMGLIRAFLTAGARTVVATQWPVEDLPTMLLMERFYQQLVETTVDPAAALRDAQVWLRELTTADAARLSLVNDGVLPDKLKAAERPFADPRHWAGYVIYGA